MSHPQRPVFVRPDLSWHDFAACRDESVDVFFGRENERGFEKEQRERKAKGICSGCTVRLECLDYAVSSPQRYGIWGGLDEDQRASERRRRQRQVLKEKAA